MWLLTGGHVPGQNCTITLKRTISELGNLNARKFAIRDLELGLALLKAGKVKWSGGQPLSFSRRIDSLPSSLVATRCPAIMSNGPKTYTQRNYKPVTKTSVTPITKSQCQAILLKKVNCNFTIQILQIYCNNK